MRKLNASSKDLDWDAAKAKTDEALSDIRNSSFCTDASELIYHGGNFQIHIRVTTDEDDFIETE